MMKNTVEKIISYIPGVGKWRNAFLKHSVPGQWGSPVPDWEAMLQKHDVLFNTDRELPGINMNTGLQTEICRSCKQYVPAFYNQYVTAPTAGQLFSLSNNIYYRYYDGANLFAFMQHYRPRRIIEIGSGFSSALMLDINKRYFDGQVQLTFIEPNPERLLSLVPDRNNISLVEKNIQDVDTRIFSELEENDFLFVDSSHIAKMDSDLNKVLFDILPVLKKSVLIHFHDITYPFEYPRQVIEHRHGWNEAYFLRAFLMYNQAYTIEFMNSYLERTQRELFYDTFRGEAGNADWDINYGGSCWLRKQVF